MNDPRQAYVVATGPVVWKNKVAHRPAAIVTGGNFGKPMKIVAKYGSFEEAADVLKRSIEKWYRLCAQNKKRNGEEEELEYQAYLASKN